MAWVKICIFTNIRFIVLWKRPKYLRSFTPAYKTYYVVYWIVKITFQSQNFRDWKSKCNKVAWPTDRTQPKVAQKGTSPLALPPQSAILLLPPSPRSMWLCPKPKTENNSLSWVLFKKQGIPSPKVALTKFLPLSSKSKAKNMIVGKRKRETMHK